MGITATPFTGADLLFERARVAHREKADATIVGFGYPNSKLGEVTPEWIAAQKKERFGLYTETMRDHVISVVGEEASPVRIYGVSLGAPIALEMYRTLPEKVRNRARMVLYNPPATILAMLGYPVTAIFDMKRTMPQDLFQLENEFYKAQKADPDSHEQIKLKNTSLMADMANVMLHNPLLHMTEEERRRMHIVQGKFDGTSRPYNFHGATINTAHWIPWINRDKKW